MTSDSPSEERDTKTAQQEAADELSELLGYTEAQTRKERKVKAKAKAKETGSEPQEPSARAPLAAPVFARLLLGIVGGIWLAIGLVSLFSPEFVAGVTDFELTSALARYEYRAMYGGLSIALGSLHIAAILRKNWLQPMLLLSTSLLLGLSGGRIASLFLDGPPGVVGFGLLLVEVVCMVGMLLALHRLRRSNRLTKSN